MHVCFPTQESDLVSIFSPDNGPCEIIPCLLRANSAWKGYGKSKQTTSDREWFFSYIDFFNNHRNSINCFLLEHFFLENIDLKADIL